MPLGVLIVEDEATLASNIRTYLQRSGYRAEVAGSAEEGFALLERFRPDAVLLDLRLPGMDGLAALVRFQALDPKLTVILTTGHGTAQTLLEAMKAGAYDVLTKPVSLGKLRFVLDQALADRRRAAAVPADPKLLSAEC